MKTILIFIEDFYPAYKGGGPIQSITNLIISLENEYHVLVVTSAYELQSNVIMPGIITNAWENVLLPQSKKHIRVWYAEKFKPGYRTLKKIIVKEKPAFVYINGMFSFNFFLKPLIAIQSLVTKPKVIICPRGMIQKGALDNKSFKKKLYLKALKSFGLVDKAFWHATNTEEKEDIFKVFGINNRVCIALNIPKKPLIQITFLEKQNGTLNLIYLSLIAEKKNLLFLLQLIKSSVNIRLDIYGPVKDTYYWGECKKLLDVIPDKARYLGGIEPLKVQDTFSKYHASVLLTKGENFGHALYESLSAGRPIITSNFTPWDMLEQKQAGWNLDISDVSTCLKMLHKISALPYSEFTKFYKGAHDEACYYYKKSNNLADYKKLFCSPGEDQ